MSHKGIAVEVFLYRQQYLVWIYGFYEVVGNLAAYGLVHDVFLLALGNHDYRHIGLQQLDLLQGFKTAYARHVLIEDYEVEVLRLYHVESVAAVGHGLNLISLVFQKQNVRLQQVDFIVSPKNVFFTHNCQFSIKANIRKLV